MVITVFLKGARMICWPLTLSFIALLQCDCEFLHIFSVISSTLMSFSMVVVELGWNINSVILYVDLQAIL